MLDSDHKQLVIDIDSQVKSSLSHTEDPAAIFISLSPHMSEIQDLLCSLTREELDMYCQQYEGFCFFMAFLESLAVAINNGEIPVPTYH